MSQSLDASDKEQLCVQTDDPLAALLIGSPHCVALEGNEKKSFFVLFVILYRLFFSFCSSLVSILMLHSDIASHSF